MFFNLRVLIGEKDTGPNGIFGIMMRLLRVYFSQSCFITEDCRSRQRHINYALVIIIITNLTTPPVCLLTCFVRPDERKKMV